VLTDKGMSLWPIVRDLLSWGDEFYSPGGARRVFEHIDDAGASIRTARAIPATAQCRLRTC
jgi:DNA-binding HxlR family transcriptional regulator